MFNKFPAKTDILGALRTLDLEWKIVECIKKTWFPFFLTFYI